MTHETRSTIQSAVSELYRVFKPYRLGDDFTGCDHCISTSDSRHLATIPLRELTVRDLDHYAFKAMTTWGTDRHFKHFLPRLLELATDHFLAFNFPEVLLGKLTYAKWISWPEPERRAIHQFLDGFWLHQLNSPGDFPTDERIRTTLGGLAQACDTILPFLELWTQQSAPLPALHLAQLVNDTSDDIMTTGTVKLWGSSSAQCQELVKWLSSQPPLGLLDTFRHETNRTFPLVLNQLDGIRAATSTE